MEHVAQAHGLGRTGVEGMVILVSANCVAHQLTQPDAVASDKATWLSIAGLGKALSGHAPSEAMGRT